MYNKKLPQYIAKGDSRTKLAKNKKKLTGLHIGIQKGKIKSKVIDSIWKIIGNLS